MFVAAPRDRVTVHNLPQKGFDVIRDLVRFLDQETQDSLLDFCAPLRVQFAQAFDIDVPIPRPFLADGSLDLGGWLSHH